MVLAVGRYWSKIDLRLKSLRAAYVVGATYRLLCFCQRVYRFFRGAQYIRQRRGQRIEGDGERYTKNLVANIEFGKAIRRTLLFSVPITVLN